MLDEQLLITVSPGHVSALLWACVQVPGNVSQRALPTYSCLFLEVRNFPQISFLTDLLVMIPHFFKQRFIIVVV